MTKPPFGVTTGRCRCDLPSQDTPVVKLFAKEQDFSSASSAGCPYLVSPLVEVVTNMNQFCPVFTFTSREMNMSCFMDD